MGFTPKRDTVNKALGVWLLEWTLFLQQKIHEITPRDPQRPPKDPSRPVTGNLQRSIQHKKVNDTTYKIWVQRGPASSYAEKQEFGDATTPPRSYLRKWLADNKEKAQLVIAKTIKKFLK